MPRVAPEVLNCVFYLYPTVEDARRGENAGGTGFFFSIVPRDIPGHYYYAVTNWHNIFSGAGAPVIRVNTKDGGADIFDLDHLDWAFKPGWHDLAVADITLDLDKHNVSFATSDEIVTLAGLKNMDIGLGSDVFMVGRFMDHDGGLTNVPSVRFGNVAVMPQNIKQPTGAADLPSFILDLHSRTGFSGSPVYVFYSQTKTRQGGTLQLVHDSPMVRLLGVHWGQFPERWEIGKEHRVKVRQKESGSTTGEPAVAEFVKGFSGMTLVVPAEAILELLDMPKLRETRDAVIAEARMAHQNDPVAESEEPPTTDENPRHREDFNSLLNAAAAGPKPSPEKS